MDCKQNRAPFKCYKCGKEGHKFSECKANKHKYAGADIQENNSFERSENVLYAVAPLTGGKIQNAIWPKIWMLIFILGQNKLKQAKKNFDPTRPDPARPGPARPDPA